MVLTWSETWGSLIFWETFSPFKYKSPVWGSNLKLSLSFKLLLPELPFMDRVGIVFLLCVGLAVIVSLIESKGDHANAVELNDINFKTTSGFNLASLALTIVVAAFYIIWW